MFFLEIKKMADFTISPSEDEIISVISDLYSSDDSLSSSDDEERQVLPFRRNEPPRRVDDVLPPFQRDAAPQREYTQIRPRRLFSDSANVERSGVRDNTSPERIAEVHRESQFYNHDGYIDVVNERMFSIIKNNLEITVRYFAEEDDGEITVRIDDNYYSGSPRSVTVQRALSGPNVREMLEEAFDRAKTLLRGRQNQVTNRILHEALEG